MEEGLELSPGALDASRDCLKRFGNLSVASVLLLLEEALTRPWSGPGLLLAMGPDSGRSWCYSNADAVALHRAGSVVGVQRLFELRLSRSNERHLRIRGGRGARCGPFQVHGQAPRRLALRHARRGMAFGSARRSLALGRARSFHLGTGAALYGHSHPGARWSVRISRFQENRPSRAASTGTSDIPTTWASCSKSSRAAPALRMAHGAPFQCGKRLAAQSAGDRRRARPRRGVVTPGTSWCSVADLRGSARPSRSREARPVRSRVRAGRQPGTKPCGEGLLPRALANLAELGLRHADLLDWGRPLSGVRYISRCWPAS